MAHGKQSSQTKSTPAQKSKPEKKHTAESKKPAVTKVAVGEKDAAAIAAFAAADKKKKQGGHTEHGHKQLAGFHRQEKTKKPSADDKIGESLMAADLKAHKDRKHHKDHKDHKMPMHSAQPAPAVK